MKKLFLILFLLHLSLFGGVFEHLLNKDIDYLFAHNFRCHDNVCISPEKNIFNQDEINTAIKFIKAIIDNEKKVFKIEIELTLQHEAKDAFYEAVLNLSDKDNKNITYHVENLNDKYGNHTIIVIIDTLRSKKYMDFLTEKYTSLMKQYK